MLVQVVMHPFLRKTFHKQLVIEFLTFLFRLSCLHDSRSLLVETHYSAFEATDGRELELLESFFSMIKFLKLDESKVEVFEHWSIWNVLKISPLTF